MLHIQNVYRHLNAVRQDITEALTGQGRAPAGEPLLPRRQPAGGEADPPVALDVASEQDPQPASEARSTDSSNSPRAPQEAASATASNQGASRTLSRRRATAYVALTGFGGGAVHGVDAYVAQTQAGASWAGSVRASLSIFSQVLGSATVAAVQATAAAVLPSTVVHAGEVASYRAAAWYGYFSGVAEPKRQYFSHWQPGTTWPSGCERPLGPSRPPPAWCPDFGLAGLQRAVQPVTTGFSYAAWGAAAGAALGAAVLYTPLGKKVRAGIPDWAWSQACIGVTATLGALVLLPFEFASRTP